MNRRTRLNFTKTQITGIKIRRCGLPKSETIHNLSFHAYYEIFAKRPRTLFYQSVVLTEDNG